jgi:hypothetical protein
LEVQVLTNQLGRPVSGQDFYDREETLAHVWQLLDDGNNLLLLAPRRIGKTSLMNRLKEQAAAHKFRPVFASVADVNSEVGFIKRLYTAIQGMPEGKELMSRISKGSVSRYLKRIRKIGIGSTGGTFELADDAEQHWTELGDALGAALGESNAQWLLLIDELPIFVLCLIQQDSSMARARQFLAWLRELRVGPNAARSIRWFLAGSVGLDTVTRRAQIGDTINDLYSVTNFGPFSESVADDFLGVLAHSYQMELGPDVKSHIRKRVGWLIPYHLQILFAELRSHCHDAGVGPDTVAVDQAYEVLLSPAKRNLFDFWEQRLIKELGSPEDKFAVALTNAAARDERGATRTTLEQVLAVHISDLDERDRQLHFLLDVLQSDGYLVMDGDRYRFRSSLLREFWLRRVAGE